MAASIALRFTGWALLVVGVILWIAPGEIAVALGTPGPMPADGANDPIAMAFWRQLTFMRMFSTAAIAVGAICIWCQSRLTPAQQTSFLKVLVGVFAWMFLMALSQQTAIWGASLGWALVGVIGAVALSCLAALLDNASGRHQGTLSLGPLALTFAVFTGVAAVAAFGTGNHYYIGAAVFWCLGCLLMAPYVLRAFVAPRRTVV